MSAPFLSRSTRGRRRRVMRLGREYLDVAYTPKFALGLLCADERDQQRCFRRLSRLLPNREIKVLVI